jgi:hypothetical protein
MRCVVTRMPPWGSYIGRPHDIRRQSPRRNRAWLRIRHHRRARNNCSEVFAFREKAGHAGEGGSRPVMLAGWR